MCECPLSSALLSGLTGQGGTPLNVAVTLTTADEVIELRQRIKTLEAMITDHEREFNRVQYLYMCEVSLNLQLQDIMRAYHVSFPSRLCTTGVRSNSDGG